MPFATVRPAMRLDTGKVGDLTVGARHHCERRRRLEPTMLREYPRPALLVCEISGLAAFSAG